MNTKRIIGFLLIVRLAFSLYAQEAELQKDESKTSAFFLGPAFQLSYELSLDRSLGDTQHKVSALLGLSVLILENNGIFSKNTFLNNQLLLGIDFYSESPTVSLALDSQAEGGIRLAGLLYLGLSFAGYTDYWQSYNSSESLFSFGLGLASMDIYGAKPFWSLLLYFLPLFGFEAFSNSVGAREGREVNMGQIFFMAAPWERLQLVFNYSFFTPNKKFLLLFSSYLRFRILSSNRAAVVIASPTEYTAYQFLLGTRISILWKLEKKRKGNQ